LSSALPWQSFNVLVVSPTPTHPQDHGNRKRIFEICTQLQTQGARIHFLHYPGEHDWRHARPVDREQEMRAAWDGYDLVAPSRPLHSPSIGTDHQIDEWADPSVAHHIAWLCRVQSFDLVIVNYTWMSFCLEAVPKDVFKVCDSHDVFGGRRELLEAHGIAPEFFHTTRSQEAIGLSRADLVWAIKDSEQAYFERDLRLPNCLTMLHAEPSRKWWTAPPSQDGWLRAGVIGARNNVNRLNLEQFLNEALPVIREYMAPVKIVIAGGCADDFKDWKHPNIEVLGRVPEIADFYRGVDVVLAPMQFSTGLKIKVGEALASGAPLMAHAHAMEGYPTREPLHQLPSFKAMGLELAKLAFDRAPLIALAASSDRVCADIQYSVRTAIEATRQQVVARFADMICIVAPMAALDETCLLHDHLLAAMDYLRFTARLALFLTGEPAKPTPEFLSRFNQNIPVFVEPALLDRLGAKAPPAWTGIELPELLDGRPFRRAYILADCHRALAFGTGRLSRVFVRHDAVELAGGDGDALIDTLRASADVVVLAADTSRLMRWHTQYGIEDVVEVAFRRTGQFVSLDRAAAGRKPRQRLFMSGRPGDPIVQAVLELAGRLGVPASALDLTRPDIAAELRRGASKEDAAAPLGLLSEASLFVEVASPSAISAILGEAAQRYGIPRVQLLRGLPAAALHGLAGPMLATTIGGLLRTVAQALTDPAMHAGLLKDSRRDLASRTNTDAGWTWLWHNLNGPSSTERAKKRNEVVNSRRNSCSKLLM
jgi:Glycosyl transferases group 1